MPNPAFNGLFVAPQALAPTASIPAPPSDAGSDFNDFLKLAGQGDNTLPDLSTDQFDESGPSWFDLNSWTSNHSQLSLQQSTDQPSNYSSNQTPSQNQSSSDTSWQSRTDDDRGSSSSTKLSNQPRSDRASLNTNDAHDRHDQDPDDDTSASAASSANADQSLAPKPSDKNAPTAADGKTETKNSGNDNSQSNEIAGETTEAVTATIVSTATNTAATGNTGRDTKTVAQSPDATKSPNTKTDQTLNRAAQIAANVQTPAEDDPATAVTAKAAQAQISQIPSKAAIENKKSAVKAENELAAQSQESTDASANESSAQNNAAQLTDQPQLQSASAQQSAVDAIASKSAASAGKSKRPTSSSTDTSTAAQQPASITNNAAATAIADQTVAIAVASVSSTTTDQSNNLSTSNSSPAATAQANLPASLTANALPAANNAAAANMPGRIDASATQSNPALPAPRSASAQIDTVRFVQRVANAFKSIDDQGGEMRLRLSPPELGSLKVEVSVRNGTMTARLETENNTTRSLLLDNLPALRERLAGQNIKIHTFDVDLKQDGAGNGSANPSPDFSGARQGASRSQNNLRLAASRNNDASGAAPITNAAVGPLGNGQINIVV